MLPKGIDGSKQLSSAYRFQPTCLGVSWTWWLHPPASLICVLHILSEKSLHPAISTAAASVQLAHACTVHCRALHAVVMQAMRKFALLQSGTAAHEVTRDNGFVQLSSRPGTTSASMHVSKSTKNA
eukprot:1159911-Pelagomonas_calceolata.AAC.16